MTASQGTLLACIVVVDVLALRFACRARHAWRTRATWNTNDPLIWRRRRPEGTLPPLGSVLPSVSIPEYSGVAESVAPQRVPVLEVAARESTHTAAAAWGDGDADDPYLVSVSPPRCLDVAALDAPASVQRVAEAASARPALPAAGITERVRVEEALRVSEERFRRVFAEAPIGLVLVELDGTMTLANLAMSTITGYTQAELASMTFQQITHPDDLPANLDLLHGAAAEGGGSYTLEKRYRHAAGHDVWVSVHATVLRDEAGKAVNIVAHVQDINERRASNQELQRLADEDSLTGLLNRRSFERAIEIHRQAVSGQRPTGAVLMLDLDGFKQVNDRLGHGAGDKLLVSIAGALRARLRESDIVARIGGDEFGVLLPTADPDAARAVSRSVLASINHEMLVLGLDAVVTMSIGIAVLDGAGETAEMALIKSDMAMYAAKRAGGDQFVVYAEGNRAPDICRST
jgi:diguanylate cyclase (GGDEF)-like protein/PAS domain S-box-containing protein